MDANLLRSRSKQSRSTRAAVGDQGSAEDLVKASTGSPGWTAEGENQAASITDLSQPVSDGAPLLEAPASVQEMAEAAVGAHSDEAVKKGALIHDFCFGIPYGSVLALGGVIWYFVKRQPVSLWHGLALGLTQLLLSAQSLKAWKKGASSFPYILGSLGIALFLTVTKGRAFAQGAPFLPMGLTALTSILMALFFFYVLLAGGNPPPKANKAPAV
ncbi:hypothetical protein KFL_002920080 [Klebsormidium nitens]|uniref:Uncharacterized protein n=1 Tax=Klebsormidium nitens TaxID=105231 RepID=A0A1Y1IBL3_KLENI|nr:hypothetical protein KFL_002920080 [Klebsormidium nitens]|eukprot:GAQ86491.1 hypothetical protein KFL_002920080 [Klebsormidium nitens]